MPGPAIFRSIVSVDISNTLGGDVTVSSARLQRDNRPTGDWSVVIVNYNGDPFLAACLEAIARVRLRPSRVFVVDNASSDGSLFELNAYPWAEAIRNPTNLGFAGGANIGLERVETSCAVILNPDVELEPDFGHALVDAFLENPRLGVAGSLLTYPDEVTIQHAGGVIAYPTLFTSHRGRGEQLSSESERSVNIDFATGAVLAVRMETIREIDGFDERFGPVYYEDVDLSARAREAGWEVKLQPELRAIHHEGVTLQHEPAYYAFLHRNRLRYAIKHLSSDQWNREFLPAEIARIRHELAHPQVEGIPESVGLEGIDNLLRSLDPLVGTESALLTVPEYPEETIDVDGLESLRAVQGRPLRSRVPGLGRLRNWFNNLGPRWYVDGAMADQRAFNDAVVRAFESQQARNIQQDRLNREQTAELVLLALTALGRFESIAAPDIPRFDDE